MIENTSSKRSQTLPTTIDSFNRSPGEVKGGDVREDLICQNLGLIKHHAKRFEGRGFPYEDLVQVGALGLIKALNNFDPGKGAALPTFATHYIVGEIRHHLRDNGWYLKVSRCVKDKRQQVLDKIEHLTNLIQRSPSISEIARYLDTSEEELIEIIELGVAYSPLPLDSPIPWEHNDSSPSVINQVFDVGFEDEVVDKMSLDLAKKVLTKRERTIVHLRYKYDMSQCEIAKRLGISQMHVSRLLKEGLEKMRKFMQSERQERVSDCEIKGSSSQSRDF